MNDYSRARIWVFLLLLSLLACGSPAERAQEPAQGEQVDLLISGGRVLVMDDQLTVFDPGFVAVRGDQIVGVGDLAAAQFSATTEIDAEGKLILPGLVNAHQHAPMVLLRGMGNDRNLMDWLNDVIFPAEKQNVNREFVYWGTALSALEMVRSGTTTYADMYYFEDEVARASSDVGMRVVAGQTVIGFPAPDHPTPEETLEFTEGFIDEWKGHPLVTPAVAPHAPYTLSQEQLLACKELADRKDVPLIIHVAETRDEVRQIQEQQNARPVEYLNRIGLLSDRMTANHVVWVEPHELEMLKQAGVGVTHNPESNMKLASGVAPVPAMLEAGMDLGLGTDGAASNNNLDMFQEMDFMAKLHKLAGDDPTLVSAQQTLFAATLGGARALNMGDRIGSLEEGKKADLIVVGLDAPEALPSIDPYTTIVYSLMGNSVETAVVNGEVIYREGAFSKVDSNEIMTRSKQLIEKVIQSLQ